ncbi:hypothetical protein CEXT_515501 [Caerostris extrusa]|uniref:Uncharacterized protein n=1 Tax=Caerostris extrusa TaxID=172846 RepID=A0AAV4Q6J5_CAEEX|nr:hypothetical protein CEXT_515501 [Caerostris extrusa]
MHDKISVGKRIYDMVYSRNKDVGVDFVFPSVKVAGRFQLRSQRIQVFENFHENVSRILDAVAEIGQNYEGDCLRNRVVINCISLGNEDNRIRSHIKEKDQICQN